MIVADYDKKWEPLSNEHKKKDEELQQLLDKYATGSLEDLAYAIIGTYGVGKTQLLFQVHKYAIEIYKILDPREKVRKDAPRVLETVLGKFVENTIADIKVLLLVDELEGQYPILQKLDQTGERSPLMQWLESRTHPKFLAFAPAGIYELGGAGWVR